MIQLSGRSTTGLGGAQGRRRALQLAAGAILFLAGAAGFAVMIAATYALKPWSPPVLLFGIGSALLFTGGSACLLMVGAALIFSGFQRRSTF